MYCAGFSLVEGNSIYDNYGAGIRCAASDTIRGNDITYNRASGIHVAGGSNSVIEGNTIEWNSSAFGGGISVWHAYPVIRHNIIRHNDVGPGIGGGIAVEYGAPLIERNTITNNHTAYEAAGIYCCEDSTRLLFNYIAFNECFDPFTPGSGVFT
jgi:parallel beta-helix repeat protein